MKGICSKRLSKQDVKTYGKPERFIRLFSQSLIAEVGGPVGIEIWHDEVWFSCSDRELPGLGKALARRNQTYQIVTPADEARVHALEGAVSIWR